MLVGIVVRHKSALVSLVENDAVKVVRPADIFVADPKNAFANDHDVPVVSDMDVEDCREIAGAKFREDVLCVLGERILLGFFRSARNRFGNSGQ
jgi:hypothetical protein